MPRVDRATWAGQGTGPLTCSIHSPKLSQGLLSPDTHPPTGVREKVEAETQLQKAKEVASHSLPSAGPQASRAGGGTLKSLTPNHLPPALTAVGPHSEPALAQGAQPGDLWSP